MLPPRSETIREADIYRFTEGDCHIFARALNKLTGWPIYCLHHGDRNPDAHAFVRAPDGTPWDVRGPLTRKQLLDEYEASGWMRIEWKDLRKAFGKPMIGHYSYQRAGVIAQRLVGEGSV